MNLLLFISVLITSFIVVRIGAVAFELTGLEWSLAKFQALSCFTATGFTTKEAELITGNPQRRRIASVLIVLGHAGLVTMIATFANSLRPSAINIPGLPDFVSTAGVLQWINLAIIAVVIYVVYKVFTNTKFAKKLTEALRRHIAKREIVKPVSFEELLVATGGYGVSKLEGPGHHNSGSNKNWRNNAQSFGKCQNRLRRQPYMLRQTGKYQKHNLRCR